ncbi:hypothetical protein MKX03_036149 [Papaver bracteatum]|nr:hypothetical protein MKX03_036149 [Papaver bracteatum]
MHYHILYLMSSFLCFPTVTTICFTNLIFRFKFDGVVGDLTIMPKRSLNVDFTLPYTESGISMIVRIKDDEKKNPWVFLKPLSLELWLSAFGVFTFTGCVIWVLEHQINGNFRGSISKQLVMIFWFAFSTVVFAHS